MAEISLYQRNWNSLQIIQNSRKLINAKQGTSQKQAISNKIKGRILMGLFGKYQTKSHPKIKDYLYKWQAIIQADNVKSQVIVKILTQQRLSSFTFLYRIKAFCQLTVHSDQGVPQKQHPQIETILNDDQQKKSQNVQAKQKNRQEMLKKEEEKRVKKIENTSQNIGQRIVNNRNQCKKDEKTFKDKQNHLKIANMVSNLRGHLRCISEQPSLPLSSQNEFSQSDSTQALDRRLHILNQRMSVSGLRVCELIVTKARRRIRSETFQYLKNRK